MADSRKPAPDNQLSGPHWSKDYVEHLRTVYFSLIALSVAAVVLAFSPNPSEITEARKQLKAIADITDSKLWHATWLQEAAEQALAKYLGERRKVKLSLNLISHFEEPSDANAMALASPHGRRLYRFRFAEPNWIVDGAILGYLNDVNHGNGAMPSAATLSHIPPPKRLVDFKNLWNVLNEKHTIEVPTRLTMPAYSIDQTQETNPGEKFVPHVTEVTVQWTKEEDDSKLSSPSVANINLQHLSETERNYLHFNSDVPASECYLDNKNEFPEALLIMPFVHTDVGFDAQLGLIQNSVGGKPVHGSFEHSFYELDRITRNYQVLSLSELDPILESEQNRSGASFEAFGVKFPAQATTRWGIIVILAVQLYFWIHLHELARKLLPTDPGWEVAFIGMYRSRSSQILYSISALRLPVCAVLALGIQGVLLSKKYHWAYWILLMSGVLTSLALAVAAWNNSPKRLALTESFQSEIEPRSDDTC
jgi:hypothetical protein